MRFYDRSEAGQILADKLSRYKVKNLVVLALPRGGVVLGAIIAKRLGAAFGIVIVQKLGHPFDPEYALGAVAEDDEPVVGDETDKIDKIWYKKVVESARQEIKRRRKLYFGDIYTAPNVKGKTVILVDDGIATGFTFVAAVQFIKNRDPKKIIMAAPVASEESVNMLQELADEIVLLDDPSDFLGSVGAHYDRFEQIDDQEVIDYLQSE